jgi:hypothetical protein
MGKPKSKGTKPKSKGTLDANAIRITFSYDGDKLSVKSKQKIDKFLPPDDDIAGQDLPSRYWYQLTDSKNNVLHRQNLNDIIKEDIEVFSTNPDDPAFMTYEQSDKKGVFSIVIPDMPGSTRFELFTDVPQTDKTMKIHEVTKKIFHLNIKGGDDNQ